MATPVARAQRMTYEDYAALDDGRRYELVHGELLEMTPAPTSIHQRVTGRLFQLLSHAVEPARAGEVFVAPLDVLLDQENTVQPDILFIAKERAEIITDACVRGAPDLVVEVLSPSTAERDRGTKLDLYREHGVREVWLVSPESAGVQIFRFKDGEEVSAEAYTVRDTLESDLLPGLDIPVADVFARAQGIAAS